MERTTAPPEPLGSVRAMFARRRLRLAGLDGRTRALASGGLAACATMGILLAARGAQIEIPGGSYAIVAVDEPVPRLIIVGTYLALAAAAAALAAGARDSPARGARLVLVAVGLIGALIAVKSARAHSLLDAIRTVIVGRELVPAWVVGAATWIAWASLGAAVLTAVAPRRLARRLGPWFPACAAAPFLAALLVYAVAWVETRRAPDLPLRRTVEAVVASGLTGLIANIGFWAAAVFLWQAVLGVLGSRDVGERLADRLSRPRWAGTVVAAKLAWLFLGLAGLLPALLGGAGDRWDNAAHDGVFAWVYATLLAAAAALWLARRRRPLERGGELTVTAAICGGLVVALLVAAFAAIAEGIVAGASWTGGLGDLLIDISDWAGDRIILTQVLTVVGAAIAAVVLYRSRAGPPAALAMLVVFVAWAAPRTTSVAWESLADRPVEFGRIELVTLDTAVTIAAAALLLVAWRSHLRIAPALVLLAVATSTLIAHTGWIMAAVLSDRATFYLAILFAPLYQFTLGSARLNAPAEGRGARVLLAVGLAAAVITLVTVQEAIGFAGPGIQGLQSLGTLLLAMPLAAVLIAGSR